MTNEDKTIEKLQQEDLIREYRGNKEADPEELASLQAEEPWLPIETKMVVSSIIGGVIALIVLATLVHIFILGRL
jgi:hypothetical protein